MNYGSLKCAAEYADRNRIEDWVHDYLLNDGNHRYEAFSLLGIEEWSVII